MSRGELPVSPKRSEVHIRHLFPPMLQIRPRILPLVPGTARRGTGTSPGTGMAYNGITIGGLCGNRRTLALGKERTR